MNKDPENNVLSMVDKSNNSAHYSPAQALADVLERMIDPENTWSNCNKILIIGLDTGDSHYEIGWRCAGLKGSEILSLCDAMKAKMLKEMGY